LYIINLLFLKTKPKKVPSICFFENKAKKIRCPQFAFLKTEQKIRFPPLSLLDNMLQHLSKETCDGGVPPTGRSGGDGGGCEPTGSDGIGGFPWRSGMTRQKCAPF
jgi:hypothetical protein